MTIRNFDEDFINAEKTKPIWDKWLQNNFPNYESHVWKDDKQSQIEFHGDLFIKLKNTRTYFADIKNRNYTTYKKDYIMEIKHLYYNINEFDNYFYNSKEFWDYQKENDIKSYYTKEGWVYDSTADLILHGTINENKTKLMECLIYHLAPFKARKSFSFTRFKSLWLPTKFNNSIQQTLNRLIPLFIIKKFSEDLFYFYWDNKLNNFLE